MHSLRPIQVMKRTRSTLSSSISPSSKSQTIRSTPPTPQTLHKTRHSKPTPISVCYRSRKPKPIIDSLKGSSQSDHVKWAELNLAQQELYLPLTFPTGQTFRWKKTGPLQYTGVVGPHLISLKHVENGDVCYCLHHSPSENDARTALLDFLNASVSLTDVWKAFSASDARFAELACHLGGARVLRQDPLECLIQFLCSSNNNIQRITKMVDHISSLGNYLGTVGGFKFHTFPTMEQLSLISEEELRKAGFGYRLDVIILYELNSDICYVCIIFSYHFLIKVRILNIVDRLSAACLSGFVYNVAKYIIVPMTTMRWGVGDIGFTNQLWHFIYETQMSRD